MPAIAALSINDGAATPVAHTFAPVTTNGATSKHADRAPLIPAGYLTIQQEVREAKAAGQAHRIIIGFSLPVLATVDGSLTRVRLSSAQVVFNFAQDSTEQERKDALAYVTNYLSNATVKTSVQNIEPFY